MSFVPFSRIQQLPTSTLFPYTTLFRSRFQDVRGLACGDLSGDATGDQLAQHLVQPASDLGPGAAQVLVVLGPDLEQDRKSTRLNSSHPSISYAVFCLKKKIIVHMFIRS